jgi:hypothetical protein
MKIQADCCFPIHPLNLLDLVENHYAIWQRLGRQTKAIQSQMQIVTLRDTFAVPPRQGCEHIIPDPIASWRWRLSAEWLTCPLQQTPDSLHVPIQKVAAKAERNDCCVRPTEQHRRSEIDEYQ